MQRSTSPRGAVPHLASPAVTSHDGANSFAPQGFPPACGEPESPDTFPPDGRSGAWGHDPHWHTFHQFLYAATGWAILRIGDETHRIDAGTGLVIPAGLPHSARFGPGFTPVSEEVDAPPSTDHAVPVSITPELRIRILDARWAPHGLAELLRDTLDRAALLPAGDPCGVVVPVGPLSGPIATHLRADPADRRTLEDFAAELHTSVVTIRRAFLEETGITFSQWRTRVRLQAAVDQLRQGRPVARVAAHVGLSPSGLLAAVRRHYECAPSELAAAR